MTWKNLPKEIKEKILCEFLEEENVNFVYDILGPEIKYCKKFKKLDWSLISYENLNYNFIREFQDFISWEDLTASYYIKPTIKFIKEFKKHFNPECWYNICQPRVLKENIIREFQDEFDEDCWDLIFQNHKLSKSFKKEFGYKLGQSFVYKMVDKLERW